MARPREQRYEVSRKHETDGRELFIADAKGTITYFTGGFSGQWTAGLPGRFTVHVATKLQAQLNEHLREDLEPLMQKGLASRINMWNVNKPQP